ncbi:MAG: helix-turn-helix transcriptional regulator [Hyphomicrobiales bacterium]|nr:helix-turn-helix transcriptional regulator [Hyphomicrobiales bacterium]
MDSDDAILTLSALGQGTRLKAFRLLVSDEPDGIPAGELAGRLAVPQNTLSAHLGVLIRAQLVMRQRHGRLIVYRANLDRFREVALFLLKDCCGGRPEVCAPLLSSLADLTGGKPLLMRKNRSSSHHRFRSDLRQGNRAI